MRHSPRVISNARQAVGVGRGGKDLTCGQDVWAPPDQPLRRPQTTVGGTIGLGLKGEDGLEAEAAPRTYRQPEHHARDEEEEEEEEEMGYVAQHPAARPVVLREAAQPDKENATRAASPANPATTYTLARRRAYAPSPGPMH